jgi:hypothetical protein
MTYEQLSVNSLNAEEIGVTLGFKNQHIGNFFQHI